MTDKEVWFLGFRFTLLQFLGICLGWTFFIAFIWPMIIGSYWFVSVFVCFAALLFAGIVNSKLLLGLVALFFVSKRALLIYQYFMLVASALLATWVFSWFVRLNTFKFIDHLIINAFTVYMYYRALVSMDTERL